MEKTARSLPSNIARAPGEATRWNDRFAHRIRQREAPASAIRSSCFVLSGHRPGRQRIGPASMRSPSPVVTTMRSPSPVATTMIGLTPARPCQLAAALLVLEPVGEVERRLQTFVFEVAAVDQGAHALSVRVAEQRSERFEEGKSRRIVDGGRYLDIGREEAERVAGASDRPVQRSGAAGAEVGIERNGQHSVAGRGIRAVGKPDRHPTASFTVGSVEQRQKCLVETGHATVFRLGPPKTFEASLHRFCAVAAARLVMAAPRHVPRERREWCHQGARQIAEQPSGQQRTQRVLRRARYAFLLSCRREATQSSLFVAAPCSARRRSRAA